MTDGWWTDNIFTCPVCGSDECVPASGMASSPILMVGSYPGGAEIKKGKPLIGGAGTVLRNELGKVGIDIKRLRICNLWHHAPNENEECFAHGIKQVIKEAKGRKLVVLMGSEAVDYFCGMSVANTTGMTLKSSYLSMPIFSLIHPSVVFHTSVGELRLSLQKLDKYLQQEKIL